MGKMPIYIVILLFGLSYTDSLKQCGVDFRLASYYGNSMVLQRSPLQAVLWGYAHENGDGVSVTVLGGQINETYRTQAANVSSGEPVWMIKLDPMDAGGPYIITVESNECVITLIDILFGDIWFCSGQSNMEHRLDQIDDPEEDLAGSVNYPDIRTMVAARVAADSPLEDASVARQWVRPSADIIAPFSAVCWLFGQRLYNFFQVPVGLIQSSYSGTRIEAWSSPQALDRCFPDGVVPGGGPNEASALYNSMIHPFQKMTIYASIWYQGESNVYNPEDYACAQKAMVEDWRAGWFVQTNGSTTEMFPFGLVQVGPFTENSDYGLPDVRWAQTAGLGYLPNEELQSFFMAVAMDLPDFDSPYGAGHPRYKRQIADRLHIAALSVAYQLDMYMRFQGPFPSKFVRTGDNLNITYDYGYTDLERRDSVNATYFQICCSPNITEHCAVDNIQWTDSTILDVGNSWVQLAVPCSSAHGNQQGHITGVRYAWRDSPCAELERCAIYSIDKSPLALPAPQFVHHGLIDEE